VEQPIGEVDAVRWWWRLRQNPDDRLYVGRRDCTKDVDGMSWQVAIVEDALRAAAVHPIPLVTAVLCFIGADWPLIGAPNVFKDVRLESERSIKKLVVGTSLDTTQIDRLYQILARALPAK
jgi:hypothetical protein